MLIDEVLNQFDVSRIDIVAINGRPEQVYRALVDYDLADLPQDDRLIGALFALRGLPDRAVRLFGARPEPSPVTSLRLADLPLEGEWVCLGADDEREIVFGAAGRYWNGPITWQSITKDTFASFAVPNSARIAANLVVTPYSAGRVLVSYETRVAATDERARRGVRRYWRLLSPFIGVVLRGMLEAVKQRVEASAHGAA